MTHSTRSGCRLANAPSDATSIRKADRNHLAEPLIGEESVDQIGELREGQALGQLSVLALPG
jgi:hypothetical protein